MNKIENTRFHELNETELSFLEHSMSFNYINTAGFEKLKNEISRQIELNKWNKIQLETETKIQQLEKELSELKKNKTQTK